MLASRKPTPESRDEGVWARQDAMRVLGTSCSFQFQSSLVCLSSRRMQVGSGSRQRTQIRTRKKHPVTKSSRIRRRRAKSGLHGSVSVRAQLLPQGCVARASVDVWLCPKRCLRCICGLYVRVTGGVLRPGMVYYAGTSHGYNHGSCLVLWRVFVGWRKYWSWRGRVKNASIAKQHKEKRITSC